MDIMCLDAIATSDPREAFSQADVILMVGAMPRKEGMLRKDLLQANASIFKAQGTVINEVAKKNVKVQGRLIKLLFI